MVVQVEVCVDSYESVLAAKDVVLQNENRFELCANLIHGGGTTPTLGLLRHCTTLLPSSRFMIMIRPRPGTFIYTDDEVETMIQDISVFKAEGVRGFVFGVLGKDGEVDLPNLRKLVHEARPCEVTFHRAFDVTASWKKEAFDALSSLGVTRILTSGHASSALAGAAELAALLDRARALPQPFKICPASGVNAATAKQLLLLLPGLEELHLSASSAVRALETNNQMVRRGADFGFGSGERWTLDKRKLEAFWDVVQDWNMQHA